MLVRPQRHPFVFGLMGIALMGATAGCEVEQGAHSSPTHEDGGEASGLDDKAQSAGTVYEAENRSGTSGCAVATNSTGFTGTGFMDFGGNGTWIQWNSVRATTAGRYVLGFRYANGGGSARTARISVNGKAAGEVSFDPTGAWTTWQVETLEVSLAANLNTIEVRAISDAGGPNLDHLVVTPADACPADPAKTAPGVCGCGVADSDRDTDGTPDCNDACATDAAKTAPGTCGCGVSDADRDADGTADCKDSCPTDARKTVPGTCGCGVPEGSCGGEAIRLPIEVFGPSGTQASVSFQLSAVDGITHALVTCHSCGYNNHALDSDASKVKAAIRVNNGPQIALKHYTLTANSNAVGTAGLTLVHPDDADYGGIGGGFRTNTMLVPVTGLRAGTNTLSFTHVNADASSIGFRILAVNLVKNGSRDQKVLDASRFVQDDPSKWTAESAIGSTDSTTVQNAIRDGRTLWFKTDHLYDPALDALDGVKGSGRRPLDGKIRASCSDCHAQDGRDLEYFNFSSYSIIERSYFHGLSRDSGRKIAAYIRSLNLPVLARARPWNPPYQPGPGLDGRPAYEWAAGAGIDAVLSSDADMRSRLFPNGTSNQAVKAVVNRFGTLNMRELPVALQMPDWNQWLPTVHPKDGFDSTKAQIVQDEDGKGVGKPFYELLYDNAKADPSPRNLGDLVTRLEKWFTRGGTCYTQTVTKGPGWRAGNSLVAQATSLGSGIPAGIGADQCEDVRYNRALTAPLELAKHGLNAWTSIKLWEIQHTRSLETRSAAQTLPVCEGQTCVNASEARGWVTDDRFDRSLNVFTRAPHYLAYNSREFHHQEPTVGRYESSAWYHLQMVLNSGYRQTAPSHFPYTITFIEMLQSESGVPQSFRLWASLIKMRQTQTNGIYGDEAGLDLRTAQPHVYFSNPYGDTSVRAGVGNELWKQLMEAMLTDLVASASFATQADWDAAEGLSAVQDRTSREFTACPECFTQRGVKPFPEDTLQGRNIARLVPQLRKVGVSETVINQLLDWSARMWIYGPWSSLRQ